MKKIGWIVAGIIMVAWLFSQATIATQKKTIATLEKACAVYHHKLTGEPHPFYHE